MDKSKTWYTSGTVEVALGSWTGKVIFNANGTAPRFETTSGVPATGTLYNSLAGGAEGEAAADGTGPNPIGSGSATSNKTSNGAGAMLNLMDEGAQHDTARQGSLNALVRTILNPDVAQP